MAAVSLLGSATWNTLSGTKTVTATPAVGDLLAIVTAHSNNTASVAPTDDNSSGTYTLLETAVKSTSTDTMQVWVRDSLIASASSTVFTHAPGTTNGGGLAVLKITGMNRVGAGAERQSAKEDNQGSPHTPAPVFSAAVLTANPVIGAVFNNSNPAGVTPRSSPAYGELVDDGYTVPTRGLEIMSIDSGETGTTITWGGTSASVSCCLAVELEASGLITPTGIASAEVFGIPSLLPTLAVTGIASAEAFGTPTVSSSAVTLTCVGIASAEAFGTSSLSTVVNPVSVASAEAIGTPTLDTIISPDGIATAEAFGTAVVGTTISPVGIGSAEVFGVPAIDTQIICTGILSAEAFGSPSLTATLSPAGVASAEAFGVPSIVEEPKLAMSFYHPADNSGNLTGGSSITAEVSQTLSNGFPGTDDYPVVGQGILRTGSSGGTAQLQLRAEVAAIITARAGLTLVIEKIA